MILVAPFIAGWAVYVLIRVLMTIPSGVLRVRGGEVYVRADRPIKYWTAIATFVVICCGMVAVAALILLGIL